METVSLAPNRVSFAARATIALVITALLLWALWRHAAGLEMGRFLAQLDWQWALGAVIPYTLVYLARALRFWILTDGARYGEWLAITALHGFFLRIMPFRTGELAYAMLVRRSGLAELGQAVVWLLLLRLLDAGVVSVFFRGRLCAGDGIGWDKLKKQHMDRLRHRRDGDPVSVSVSTHSATPWARVGKRGPQDRPWCSPTSAAISSQVRGSDAATEFASEPTFDACGDD